MPNGNNGQSAVKEKDLPHGYHTVSLEYNGHKYRLTYYKGFVSRCVIHPNGDGTALEFPIPQECYVCPQPDPPVKPMVGPEGVSWLKLNGGPHNRAVKLRIDNTPNGHDHDYKGPIKKFRVQMKHPSATVLGAGANAQTGDPVTVEEGGDQVANITVTYNETVTDNTARGGVTAFQIGGGEIIEVWDDAQTCPVDCP
jgi:hypothetical protein